MMPKKTPISLTEAAHICLNFSRKLFNDGLCKEAAFFDQQIDWSDFISQKGFHVVFSKDDFDLEKMTDFSICQIILE